MTDLISFYPSIDPYDTGMLEVSGGHSIYYEQSGNPDGKPAIYLHGGPGGGSSPGQRRVFNPEKYRIILFDQRGCGRSTPFASLEENTTWDLVADMERIREHLGIEKWLVCGGSWGSTLALSYALSHTDRVTELILRGIFTLRKAELAWYYQYGASQIFPEEWERFLAPIAESDRGNLIEAYYAKLTGEDRAAQAEAARAWSMWEGSTINLLQRPGQIENYGSQQFSIAFARIECHYFIHGGWFETDNWLIDEAPRLEDVPTVIVQGRYDVCTPMTTAWDLHKALPHARFEVIPDAGHAYDEPGITDALVRATNEFAG